MKVIASHGSHTYIQMCKDKISRLNRFNSATDLPHALYVVVWHQDSRAYVAGFSRKEAASALYKAISDKCARVLVNRQKPEVFITWIKF